VVVEPSAPGYSAAAFHSFAARARVIVFNPGRVSEPPRSLAELVDERWGGRVGIARPQFGTTRGHVGLLLLDCGEDWYRSWVEGMRRNRVRVYDGNATVVRAVAQGEIDLALTDTDDVWSGQRNGWPVDLVYARNGCDGGDGAAPGDGPLLIPNTAGLVRGRPNPEPAQRLLEFLLSARVERMMAESESRNIPLRGELRGEFGHLMPQRVRTPGFDAVAERIPRALEIWDEVMR
jgi:iron(III) transport system substrate-binding protein